MTTKADYTDEEWAALRRAPTVAGFAVSLADPGGPIELTKESMAAMRAAGAPPTDDELLVAVSQDALAQQQQRNNVLKELDLKAATVREQIADELRRVNEILEAKATPEEADAFRRWLMQAAQASAEAAKEGGFLGIGATRVSEGEEAMLAKLREILGLPSG
jgi:transcription antitermination factor NusG